MYQSPILWLVNQLPGITDTIIYLLLPFHPLSAHKIIYCGLLELDQVLLSKTALTCGGNMNSYIFQHDPVNISVHRFKRTWNRLCLQKQSGTGEWSLVQVGSRFLIPTELRYAIINLELLAATWEKLKYFLGWLTTDSNCH